MPSPSPSSAGWQVTESAIHFENKVMRLRGDTVQLPDGSSMEYAYVERGEAVILVPITAAGEMVLIEQYRHPVRERCLEVPAGTARDAQGLSLEEVAGKELREEVGAEWSALEKIGSFYSNNALTDEECHVFLCTGVKLNHAPEREPSEQIRTKLLPVLEAVRLAESGGMKTGPAALAVLMAVPHLRSLGLLRAAA